MLDSLRRITALFGCQYGAFCKSCSCCADDRILTIGLGVGVPGNICALVEVRCVLMDQSMRVNLVAILVATNLDPNVANFTIGSRDFIQRKCNAFESTTALLERAAVREFANH